MMNLPRTTALDREGPLPLYFQLREALLRDAAARGLRPGDRLPTEAELEAGYGVSRSTIRQALADLEADGLVRRVQGKGTFLGAPKIQHVPLLTSFSELLRSQGHEPSHRLLESAVRPAPPEAAAALSLEPDAECRYVRRLFLADGDPVGVAETWLPRALLAGADERLDESSFGNGSLYAMLESAGLVLHRAVETINPGVASRTEARLLGLPARSPLLVIVRTTFTPDDEPVEYTRLLFVGERYEYRVEMRRPTGFGGR